MTATTLASSQNPGGSPQQILMTRNLTMITYRLCSSMLSEDTCPPSTVSTLEAVAVIVFFCSVAVLLDAFWTYFRRHQRINSQDIFLQRQLKIAKRNKVANSLPPAHETVPARMRVRMMKAHAERQEESSELLGENEDETLGPRIELWRQDDVDDGRGRRVRFADESGSEC